MVMRRSTKRSQLLLLEDVDDLGRSGDLVQVKPGFARNFLLPEKKAVIADPHTLKMQARLQEERNKRAEVDKKEAEVLADRLNAMTLAVEVKVDPDGHMYGSVSVVDVVRLLREQGVELERRNILLPQPIKSLGVHALRCKLKEGIPATITLKIEQELSLTKDTPQ
jgi:large subunit ribosomal protein L9